jgi:hypothetical protein
MGTIHKPDLVKLIASVLAGNSAWIREARTALIQAFGPVDLESDLLPFDHTDYYSAEFGPGLQRQILAFERLIQVDELPAIKRQTNELEWALLDAESTQGKGQRRVNLDPGYVSLGKLVLASTKDHAHRLYLAQGIYAEVTLTYQRGRFCPWPWTYPDYASERYCDLFAEIRRRYKLQLKDLAAETAAD